MDDYGVYQDLVINLDVDLKRYYSVGPLRPLKHGVTVGFPMQTADGEVIFSVGKDTLTANQLLELLERGELDAEGVRRLVDELASATS